jgi:TPR repeat protein
MKRFLLPIAFNLALVLALFTFLFITPSVLFAADKNVGCKSIEGIAPSDPAVIYNLGTIAVRQKDYDLALACLKLAYEVGDNEVKAAAANNLGYYYTEAEVKNVKEAIRWHNIAIEISNNVNSIYNLGIIYSDDLKDYPKAIEWYEKAYKLGLSDGAYSLGLLYDDDLKDYPKAIEWYEAAHKAGNKNAAHALGLLYKDALKDYQNAIKWFQISFDKHKRYGSLYWIGIMYKDGLGVKQDLVKARLLLQKVFDNSVRTLKQEAKEALKQLDRLDQNQTK